MTVHVLCLDGTNQIKIQPYPTNIALMFDALGGTMQGADDGSYERSNDGEGVYGKYLPGVGTQGRPVLRVLGNLFGDGIAEPIIRGYTFLSRVYRDGDSVIVTGFSRGATAARALAGWVVSRGLLDPSRYAVEDKEEAYRRAIAAWYLYRQGKPDLANQKRLHFIGLKMGELPVLTDTDFTSPISVNAVGVFDTVSSLGLPHLDMEGNAVFDFSICDTDLNPRVGAGFHALAADEMRELFTPTFWAARDKIVQEIFPGAHSDVGGGYAETGLSDAALMWMVDHLNGIRKIFDLSRLGRAIKQDAVAPAHDESVVFPYLATPRRYRAFPSIAVPSAVLRERFDKPTDVLPGTVAADYRPKGRYADGSGIL